jgi:hypothetical protein
MSTTTNIVKYFTTATYYYYGLIQQHERLAMDDSVHSFSTINVKQTKGMLKLKTMFTVTTSLRTFLKYVQDSFAAVIRQTNAFTTANPSDALKNTDISGTVRAIMSSIINHETTNNDIVNLGPDNLVTAYNALMGDILFSKAVHITNAAQVVAMFVRICAKRAARHLFIFGKLLTPENIMESFQTKDSELRKIASEYQEYYIALQPVRPPKTTKKKTDTVLKVVDALTNSTPITTPSAEYMSSLQGLLDLDEETVVGTESEGAETGETD